MIYEHRGEIFPSYLRTGNASKFVMPAALHFCRGRGVDVGGGRWPLPGALSVDLMDGGDAMALPPGPHDFVFSSHCLEHLANPVAALEHWKSALKPGGVLFLYLPHPDMSYWRPTSNRKHLHEWMPGQMAEMLAELGFVDVIHSERDMYWSFAAVGFTPGGMIGALTDHDRRLLRKLSIRLESAAAAEDIAATIGEWSTERRVIDGTALAEAADGLAAIAERRVEGRLSAEAAKGLMADIWDKPDAPQEPPFRGPEWSRAMEKKLQDRVQVVLADPRLTLVLQEFGAEAFRRSSIFHGLEEMLEANGARGRTCFEVGTWNGLTAVVLSRFFERVITVDIVHNPLKHRILERLKIDNVRCFDVRDNADKARIAEAHDFDFAYLDGDHAHDTEADFDLVRRCGRVLFHEAWPFQRPVWRLIHALPAAEVTLGGDGLALWRRAT